MLLTAHSDCAWPEGATRDVLVRQKKEKKISLRAVKHRNRGPERLWDLSFEIFKFLLDKVLSKRLYQILS